VKNQTMEELLSVINQFTPFHDGNSTHIDLSVASGYKEGDWRVVLIAFPRLEW
jgi:hypothetical protein